MKKQTFSKVISFLLVICLSISSVSSIAFAEELPSDIKAELPKVAENAIELAVGETTIAAGKSGESVLYHFTALEEGKYVFSSDYELGEDPYCEVYDGEGNYIDIYDYSPHSVDFQVALSCEAGDEYFFEVKDSEPVEFRYYLRLVKYTDDFTVSIEDVRIKEGNTYLAEDIIEIDGEVISLEFQKYDVVPDEITVTTSDGETFTDDIREVIEHLYPELGYWVDFEFSDDQSYYNQWVVGNHTATITWGEKSYDYNVIIVENESPIASIIVSELIKYEGDLVYNGDYVEIDGELIYKQYQMYDITPKEITVTTTDGEIITGAPYDVQDQLEAIYHEWYFYECISDQSYYNHWEPGTYTANFVFNGVSYDYQVTIKDYPIISVNVEDVIRFEGDTQETIDYIEIDGEEIYKEYRAYDVEPKNITVITEDGKSYSGNYNYVINEIDDIYHYGLGYEYTSDQAYDNLWSKGTQKAFFVLGNRPWEYNVIIKDHPIVSITTEDIVRYEGDTYTSEEYVQIGDDCIPMEYECYDIIPDQVTVITSEGKKYTGGFRSLKSQLDKDYNYEFHYSIINDQSYYNQWEVGTHTVTIEFSGKTGEYNVIIKENPIQSVIVTDVVRYESDKYPVSDMVLIDEEWVDVEYEMYDVGPDEITVTTKEGKTYTGSVPDVIDKLYQDYNYYFDYEFVSDQTYDNEWGLGTHAATLVLNKTSWDYYVTIIEDPTITFIKAEDTEVYADMFHTEYEEIYDEKTGEVSLVQYNKYPEETDRLTLTLSTGETYTGTFYEVMDAIHNIFSYVITTDQSYNNQWRKGVHPVTLDIGGKTCKYNVNVTDPLIESVTVANKKFYKQDYEIEDYYYPDGTKTPYKVYNAFPESITAKTRDGKTFSGTLKDIFDDLITDYGCYPSWRWESYQSPDNEWGVGDHTADFTFGLATTKYTISIIPPKATRLYGNLRFDTSFLIADTLKDVLKKDKFDNVIVTGSTGFADALAGSYLAAKKDAPILLTSDKEKRITNVVNYIKSNLKAGGTVYILGGASAVPKTLETALEEVNCKIKRLEGALRYDTNRAILNEAGIEQGTEVLVSTGSSFADSLSASATGLPILLVSDNNLKKDTTKAYLESLKDKNVHFTILGGTSAVSQEAEKILSTYGKVNRISGETRFETSVNTAKKYFSRPENVFLAYSQNFPDGLCVGPLAYNTGAPLILTRDKNASVAADYIANNSKLHHGYAVGGPDIISDASLVKIFEVKKAADIEVIYRK